MPMGWPMSQQSSGVAPCATIRPIPWPDRDRFALSNAHGSMLNMLDATVPWSASIALESRQLPASGLTFSVSR
ncbi:MAG: hypothetical protein ABTS16_02925 [Candidatus Accumulibacter phosphatis]